MKKDRLPINLIAINISSQPEKIEQLHIDDGFPAIRLYRGGNHYVEYGKDEFT